MTVFITTAFPEPRFTYLPVLRELAARDRFGVHRLHEDPDSADIILFLDGHQHPHDPGLRAIRKHPLTLQHRRKTLIYSEQDEPWCALPGLYVSMPKTWFNTRRQRACAYIAMWNNYVSQMPAHCAPADLLFSFMGRNCHPVRGDVLSIQHPRAHLEDTSAMTFLGDSSERIDGQKRRYAEILKRSKFVLCPRGAGTSSFRLFETMAAGRVPVIVSDGWVPPAGPLWEQFSLRVRESDVKGIVPLLEEHERCASQLGAAARKAWEEWFSPETLFHRMIDSCVDILKTNTVREAPWSVACNPRYLRVRARQVKHALTASLRKRAYAT
jgi:Exostosin family